MKTLCVIPARGGSKTVPRKNIRMVEGKPLIGYIIETVLEAGVFDRTIVSTDSQKIAELVRDRYPEIEIPFLRRPEFATDSASLLDVVKDALFFFEKETFDCIFSVQPTCPLTKPETLYKALENMEKTDCDSVVTITKIMHFHPFRAYSWDGKNGNIQPLTEYTTECFLQKQDRPDAYGLTGALFGRKSSLIQNWRGRDFALGRKVSGIVVPQEEALDIDTPFDMKIFEGITLLKNMFMNQAKAKKINND